MLNTILGSKGKMTQAFIEGRRVPVTKILAGPCLITQIKTLEKDGYWAIQLGFGQKKIKNISRAVQGHLKGRIEGGKAPSFLGEVRFTDEPKNKKGENFKLGEMITLSDIFNVGDFVSIAGFSKGKGFAGGVKRWHFAGGPKTHGQSDRQRAPGAISSGTTPGRVRKGKKMAGRMGNDRVTIKNIQVISINPELNEIQVDGPVPGISGGYLVIKKISTGKLEGITEVQAQVVEGEEGPAEQKEGGENSV